MDPINQLADRLRPASAARVVVGIVESVVDGTHVRVDLGDLMVSASWPASLGTPVAGVACTLLVGDGVARVISSDQAPPTPVLTPYRMASGSATLTFSGSSTASVAISFPAGRFSVTPRWMAWLRTEALGIVIAATSETTSGATIRGATGGGAPYTGSVSVGWLAWQMTPTSRD